MGPKGSSLLAAAIATAFPILDAQATEPAVRLAQTYGSEAMPGGVEARPTYPENSRSFKKRAPASEDSFESMKAPQADDAGSATMPAPSPAMPPKDETDPAKPDTTE